MIHKLLGAAMVWMSLANLHCLPTTKAQTVNAVGDTWMALLSLFMFVVGIYLLLPNE